MNVDLTPLAQDALEFAALALPSLAAAGLAVVARYLHLGNVDRLKTQVGALADDAAGLMRHYGETQLHRGGLANWQVHDEALGMAVQYLETNGKPELAKLGITGQAVVDWIKGALGQLDASTSIAPLPSATSGTFAENAAPSDLKATSSGAPMDYAPSRPFYPGDPVATPAAPGVTVNVTPAPPPVADPATPFPVGAPGISGTTTPTSVTSLQ